MITITSAALKSTRSLTSSGVFKLLLLGIVVNAICFGILVGLVWWGLGSVSLFGAFDWLVDWGGMAVALFISYFLFPLTLPLVMSFFDVATAEAIEKEDYPSLPAAEPPFWPTLGQDARFVLKALGLNLVSLPFYLIPPLAPFVYYVLNGYLLGMEFFNIVAGRHISQDEARRLRARYKLSIIGAGALIAFSATIPLLNLITPIWGIGLMVHYFHALKPVYKTQIPDQREFVIPE